MEKFVVELRDSHSQDILQCVVVEAVTHRHAMGLAQTVLHNFCQEDHRREYDVETVVSLLTVWLDHATAAGTELLRPRNKVVKRRKSDEEE